MPSTGAPPRKALVQDLIDLGARNQNLGCTVEVVSWRKVVYSNAICWACRKPLSPHNHYMTARSIAVKFHRQDGGFETLEVCTCWQINRCHARALAYALKRAVQT